MKNKNNVWTILFRIFTILLFVFIIVLVCYDFFDTSKCYFTTEILIALSITLVIVCIDSFDSFQIGNILNIKKENEKLKEQNDNLIKIISNINNNICINNYAEVKQSTEEDRRIKLVNENNETKREIFETKTFFQTESKILNDYISKNGFSNATIIRDAKLDLMNPLMKNILFDLYIKQGNQEQFVEVKHSILSISYSYIHKQLSMVAYYNKIKGVNAKYILIIKEEMLDNNKNTKLNQQKFEQIREIFKDSINKELMNIVVI